MLRRFALKAESAWWMSRMYRRSILPLPAAGWLAADPTPAVVPFVAFLLFIWILGGAIFMLTDVIDREDDETTAPYMPLPAGLLSLGEAVAAIAAFLVGSLLLLAVAAGDAGRFAMILACVVVAFVTGGIYSKIKTTGAWASLMVGVPWSMGVVMGWLLGGAENGFAFVLVLVYALLWSFFTNVHAALRDVDRDPLVGNRTLPVRIGAVRAFQVAAACAGVCGAIVIVLVVRGGNTPIAWALAVVAAVMMTAGYRRAVPALASEGRGRVQRNEDQELFRSGTYAMTAALGVALAPLAAIVVGLAIEAVYLVGARLYPARIVHGGIAASLGIPRRAGDAG